MKTKSAYLVSFMAGVAYLLFLNHLWVNIPFWDDLFVLDTYCGDNTNWFEKFSLLTARYSHTEHRIAFNRLTFDAIHTWFNTFDFRIAIAVATVVWLYFVYFWWNRLYSQRQSAWFCVPAVLLLLNGQFYQNTPWATGALSNFCVIVWVMLSAWYALKTAESSKLSFFIAALSWAILAIFTLNTGLLAFVLGAGVFLYYRRFTWLGGWLLISLPIIAWNQWGKIRPEWEPSPLENLCNPNTVWKGTTGFLGSFVDVFQTTPDRFMGFELFGYIFSMKTPPLLLGGAVLFATAIILWQLVRTFFLRRPLDSTQLLFAVGLFFAVMVGGIATLTRTSDGDFSQVLTVKYRMYAALAYLCIWGWFAPGWRKNWRVFATGVLFIITIFSYWLYYPNTLLHRNALIADAYNFQKNGYYLHYPAGGVNSGAVLRTQNILKKGLYHFPNTFLSTLDTTLPERYVVPTDSIADGTWKLLNTSFLSENQFFTVLSSLENRFVVVHSPRWLGVRESLRTQKRSGSNPYIHLPLGSIPRGVYKVGVFLPEVQKLYLTNATYRQNQ